MEESKHTAEPWRWEFNEKHKTVSITGGRPTFDLTVMDFERWGMGGAVPRFRDTEHDGMNVMHRLCDRKDWFAPYAGREHHAGWHANVIHPDARRIVACVNACAGIDTEHLETQQAEHAEESEGGYLADVETRLEHTDRELAHRSGALFERQQRVLSVMDELRQAVEARLAAEAQLQAERASLFAENQRKQQLEQQCAQLLAERDRAERALRAAGWTYTEGAEEWRPPLGPSASPLLDKIDQLQAEREACAAICDRYATALDHGGNEYTRSRECQQAAAAIRARQEAQQ